MARDILKIKFMVNGFDLRDDDCLYKNNELIARNVRIVSEEHDHIAFNLDLLDDATDFTDIGIDLHPTPTPSSYLH